MKAYVCDGCSASSESALFPVHWLRIHFWGRPEGGDMMKLGWVEACSAKCARRAVAEAFERIDGA